MGLLNGFSKPSIEEPPGSREMSHETKPSAWPLIAVLVVVLISAGFLLRRLSRLERQTASLAQQVESGNQRLAQIEQRSETTFRRASEAETSAALAARQRDQAERAQAQSQRESEAARQQAQTAQSQAEVARQQTEQFRKQREEELAQLQQTLGQIAETRRTAMGLVVTLGSNSVRFDFDKAVLRPENREMLSRIAGVLMTLKGYGIYVYGYTDDVGSQDYNQKLSERRAQAVRDYLVQSGLNPDIITTKGYGKSDPRVPGSNSQARAVNRRVEIGIVDSRLRVQEGPSPGE
jgi:outer membrane protein OmpA-like peptidoglycan-associated protein